ncbi:hypothetical protein LTR72_011785 [Exophiala xenobiotica]|nr:hypothetical protein LTR41_011756 [Exophiala xenobiotica]KAK5215134.1 hypothetical protein LTR72_011785 [Exophiala xenobiotica]KAK5284218.1 hypothetical protein LTR14_011742 [Exophiala xenobiotica]KAK5332474.1 hypothetical protein LTR98_011409 [Exophiala xenobiotica]KAK5344473.1 hypothetical protein LTR61_011762 [Exophiala xenobiotica]
MSSSAGYRLLQQGESSESSLPQSEEDIIMGKRLGVFRASYVVALCCIGSFLFAYDTGIVGGVLTLASFQHDFRYTKAEKTQVNSNCVSILQAGAFFGCFGIWPLTSRLGRRWGFIIASVVFCIGTIMQIVNSHSIGLFYAGRVIAGLGTGAATVLVPMFSAEMAPKEIRGKLGSCFQLFFATGVCISYWVDYAAQAGISDSSSTQWQVPVGLQLVPGALLGMGMLMVKESTRWLAKKGRNEEAYASLLWVRGGVDSPEIRAEFSEILAGVELEIRQSEGLTWKELLLPSNRYRMFVAITIQLSAQLTGNTSLAYYAPQIFATIGAGNKTLFITGFFGIIKMAGVLTFIIFFVERVGRRVPFMAGAFAMGTFMLIIALIVDKHPPKASATGITSSGAAGIAMVYLEAFSFNMSWGPLPWLYIGEIFPNRIREIGIATGAASQWLFNFVMSQITPHAIDNIGWRTFLMFAIFNYAVIVYSYFFLKETKGPPPPGRQASATYHPPRSTRPPSQTPLRHVTHTIAISSAKGGVGKSTLAANLALSFSRHGLRTGLLDTDIFGPSVPTLLGLTDPALTQPSLTPNKQLIPLTSHGLRSMSIGYLLPSESAPVAWRGLMVMKALQQLLHEVDWSPGLDILVLDMPPGTGDVQLTIGQQVALSGAVVVSTPQDIALKDAVKGVEMFRKMDINVLGMVQNMSVFVCPHCGTETKIFAHASADTQAQTHTPSGHDSPKREGMGGAEAKAKELGVDFLGDAPLDARICADADRGMPTVVAEEASGVRVNTGYYERIAEKVARKIGLAWT